MTIEAARRIFRSMDAFEALAPISARYASLAVAEEDGIAVRPPEVPPPDAMDGEAWALRWAAVRAAEKRTRNFGEADRIRNLLKEAGWEIRDRRDGAIEVVRRLR